MDYVLPILTLLFVVLGTVYLFRRKRYKVSSWLPSSKTDIVKKMTADETFNYERRQKEQQLNELLDKVAEKGYESLSKKEKQLLKELSR